MNDKKNIVEEYEHYKWMSVLFSRAAIRQLFRHAAILLNHLMTYILVRWFWLNPEPAGDVIHSEMVGDRCTRISLNPILPNPISLNPISPNTISPEPNSPNIIFLHSPTFGATACQHKVRLALFFGRKLYFVTFIYDDAKSYTLNSFFGYVCTFNS